MIHPQLKTSLNELFGAPVKTGDLGVELEVEGTLLPTELIGWTWKPENSLRGANGRQVPAGEEREDTPREYVTARPVGLNALATKLEYLERELRAPNRTVRLTPRGSTHIHINMAGQTLHTAIGFILLFSAIEPVLLRLCGALRNGNLFCLPSYETGDLSFFVQSLAETLMWPHRDKYASLNLGCLPTLGSFEVRCFPNSITAVDIHRWATWLMNIRRLASGADDTFEQLMERMTNERMWLLRQVFEDYPLGACAPDNPAELTAFGAEEAYEIWHAALPLFEYDEKLKRPAKVMPPRDAMDDMIDLIAPGRRRREPRELPRFANAARWED